jgi:hypothetical protein
VKRSAGEVEVGEAARPLDSLGDACRSNGGKPARVREVHWRVVRGAGCTIRSFSVGAGHAALWYCSWGNTARLGGPPREALYTVALRGVR